MKINTKHFGEIAVDDQKIINFDYGIPGFPESKQFVLLNDKEKEDGPFYWLQSVNNGETAFAVASPFLFYPSYQPKVSDDDVNYAIGTTNPDDITVLNIMVIPDNAGDTTINLKAPVLINLQNNKGAQFIIENEEYGIRHRLCDDVNSLFTDKN